MHSRNAGDTPFRGWVLEREGLGLGRPQAIFSYNRPFSELRWTFCIIFDVLESSDRVLSRSVKILAENPPLLKKIWDLEI